MDEQNNIPSQVRAGAEQAEQIIKALNAEAPGAAEMDQSATQQQNHDQTTAGTPATLEQQLRTLQGKYDAEVPRLAKECAKLRSQVSALLEENSRLQTELQNAAKKAETSPRPADAKQLNPESFGNYGEEFVELAKRVNMLQAENERLKAGGTKAPGPKVSDTIAADQFATFYGKVSAAVSDLEALNNDPQLLKWLDETTDPETGFRMREIMNRAQQQFNHDTAIKVFNKFKQQILGAPPDVRTNTHPPITPATTQATGSMPVSPQFSGKIWTRADISKFYRDAREGAYKGREAEYQAMQADIFKAQNEGRIRG